MRQPYPTIKGHPSPRTHQPFLLVHPWRCPDIPNCVLAITKESLVLLRNARPKENSSNWATVNEVAATRSHLQYRYDGSVGTNGTVSKLMTSCLTPYRHQCRFNSPAFVVPTNVRIGMNSSQRCDAMRFAGRIMRRTYTHDHCIIKKLALILGNARWCP